MLSVRLDADTEQFLEAIAKETKRSNLESLASSLRISSSSFI